MTVLSLCVALLMLTFLGGLQAMVAAGKPVGEYTWGGERRLHGDGVRKAARLSIGVYVVTALVLLSRAGVLPGGESWLVGTLAWVVFAYGAVKVVALAMSRSRRQRRLMVPLSVVMMLAVLFIATG